MKVGRWRLLLAASCLVAAGLSPEAACAETRMAADLTLEAVRDAIGAANDGDTVQLPEGTAVWKKGWNTGQSMSPRAMSPRRGPMSPRRLSMSPQAMSPQWAAHPTSGRSGS